MSEETYTSQLARYNTINFEYEESIKDCIKLKGIDTRRDCVNGAISEYKAALSSLTLKEDPLPKEDPYDYWPLINSIAIIGGIILIIRYISKKASR